VEGEEVAYPPGPRTVTGVMPRRYGRDYRRRADEDPTGPGWVRPSGAEPMIDEGYRHGTEVAGTRLAEAVARLAGDEPIPTCPGWDADRLIAHVGVTNRWVAAMVRAPARDPLPREPFAAGVPADHLERVSWYEAGITDLVGTLRSADPAADLWSWGDGPPTRFWARRMMHEQIIHGADARWAAGDEAPRTRRQWALDGISEFLTVIPHARRDGVRPADGNNRRRRVALAASDAREVWLVDWRAPTYTWVQHHLAARSAGERWPIDVTRWAPELVVDTDAWVAGPASDVYFWRWGRPTRSLVHGGDTTVLDAWRAATQL
jgi:uncharacterized protein (TIGR03083 family)